MKLIAADEELDTELHLTEAGVRHVLGLLRQRFNYIRSCDVPVPLVPAIHPVITLSRHVLVLMEAEVTGLHNAYQLSQRGSTPIVTEPPARTRCSPC